MDAAHVPVETLLAHREWVRAVARAVVRDENAADDVEQETWLAALRAPPASASSVRGWLGAVVRSRARREGRTQSRRTAREEVSARREATSSAADLAEIADTHRRVVQAVVELAEPYRQTMLLRYFEGLSVAEVAARMEAPLDTVRARIARGLAKLRERLAREFGTDERPWHLALVPLIGGSRESAAGAAVSAAAAGGVAMATKVGLAAALALAAAGVATLVIARNASSQESAPATAALPLVRQNAPPAAAAVMADDAKPAPVPRTPETATTSPPAVVETAGQKLDRVKITGAWQAAPVLEILGEVSAKTDVDIFLCAEVARAMEPRPNESQSMTLEMANVGAREFISILAQMSGYSVAVEDTRVVILPADGRRDETKPLVPVARITADTKRTITVKGVVVDEQGAIVAHASIVAGGDDLMVAESDAAGAFTFEIGRPFTGVHARVPGRISSWVQRLDEKTKYGETVEVRLVLRGPAAAVEGAVRDADGKEAAKARVEVRPADPTGGAAPPPGATAAFLPPVTTSDDGRYRVDALPPGGFEVVVYPPAGREVRQKGSAKPGETVHLDIALPRTTTWRGTLRDAEGRAVAKAFVLVGNRVTTSAATAADGAFAIGGLEPGPAKVRVQLPDRTSIEKNVTIGPDADFRQDLWCGTGPRIAGRVLDAEGAPAAKWEVRLRPRASWLPAPRESIATDAQGRFAFEDLARGSYRIDVSRDARIPLAFRSDVATGSADVEIRLPKDATASASVRARFLDADGAPVSPVGLRVRHVASGEVALAGADPLGTVRIEHLPPGRYFVWLGVGTELGERDLAGDTDLGTIRIAKPRNVALRWDVAGDLTGATTWFAWDLVLSDGTIADRTLTQGGGQVHFDGGQTPSSLSLPAGTYRLRLTGNRIQPVERKVTVSATGEDTLTLPLHVAPVRSIAPRLPATASDCAQIRILDANEVLTETTFRGSAFSVPLLPGRYRMEADVASSTIETLRGAFEIPAENAPERLDVDLR